MDGKYHLRNCLQVMAAVQGSRPGQAKRRAMICSAGADRATAGALGTTPSASGRAGSLGAIAGAREET
jgi:hypothetical protein